MDYQKEKRLVKGVVIAWIFGALIMAFVCFISGCQTLDFMSCGDRGCAKHNWYGGCKKCVGD